jgi:ABC-type nitrate/sulfonate/bicarbonate transport system permease component
MARGLRGYAATLILLLGLLLFWEVGVRVFHVPDYILPPPSHIFLSFVNNFPLICFHSATTLYELVAGLLIGGSGGFLLGVLSFYFRSFGQAIRPLVIASQVIPVFAIAPLLVIWFGYGIWPKIIVAALIIFFPILTNVSDGLRAVDEELVDFLRSLGAREWQIFCKLRLPAALPFLFSGLKVGGTLSLVGATIGEWIGAERGLGYLMIQANALLRVDLVFAAIVAITLIGVLILFTVNAAERRLLRWRSRGIMGAK